MLLRRGSTILEVPLLLSLLRVLIIGQPVHSFLLPIPSQPSRVRLHLSRNIQGLQEWARREGVLEENGFSLVSNEQDDWSVVTTQSVPAETRLLQVPRHLIWSSTSLREELMQQYATELTPALEILQSKCPRQVPNFFLVLQLLRQSELKEQSKWHSWIQSLPPTFGTAVFMDEIDLEGLPPLAWRLASLERMHCEVFCEAIGGLENSAIITKATANDQALLQCAFNAVFTRCWAQAPSDDDNVTTTETNTIDMHMVPLGDMFNHAELANMVIYYDPHGHCNLFTKTAISKDAPLTLSYGHATNPSRFLTVFGFVDTNQSQIHCQIVVDRPTPQHIALGYTPTEMVLKKGSLAPAVWRVVLYCLLEQAPDLQQVYYQAFRNGTAAALEQQYRLETGLVLKKHVDGTLTELQALLEKERDGSLIQRHNAFLRDAFAKVQRRLNGEVRAEWERRKAE